MTMIRNQIWHANTIATLAITTPNLPDAQVGVPYATSLNAVGGLPGYNWTQTGGFLPPGLTLNGNTISGIPTSAESDSPVFTVTDTALSAVTQTFFLTVLPTVATKTLGVNLNGLAYYNPEQPWTNLLNGAGSNNSANFNHPWFTNASSVTNEEPWLQVDADGNPTSLIAGNGFTGTQAFTNIYTLMHYNLNRYTLPDYGPGVPPYYPLAIGANTYTFQFQGAFTGSLDNDASNVTYASGGTTNVVVSGGRTITSTLAPGATGSVTFNINATSQAGIRLSISAIPNSSNYPKALVICQTALLANYNTGAPQYIFHPNFLNSLTNQGTGGYSILRFMDWLNTVNCVSGYVFTTTLAAGATAATLSSPFDRANGVYKSIVGNNGGDKGQVVYVRATYQSAAVQFVTAASTYASFTSLGLTNPVSTGHFSNELYIPHYSDFSQRSLPSNLAYATGGRGVPIEVCCYLANTLGVDPWLCMPAGFNTFLGNTNYYTSLAQLVFNTLNANRKAYFEYMNEFWNTGGPAVVTSNMIGVMGTAVLGGVISDLFTQKCQMYGVQVGTMAAAVKAVYGSAFASRAVVSMGGMVGNNYVAQQAMNASAWVALGNPAPYSQGVGAIHVAPYWDNIGNSTDQNTILAAGTQAQQLNAFFGTAYTNVYGGHTYTFGANGWVGDAITQFSGQLSGYKNQPGWPSIDILGYEGGQNFFGGSSVWVALVDAATRDPRMGYCLYDPTHQLSAAHTGFLPEIIAAGMKSLNYFSSCNALGSDAWGLLENLMQSTQGPTGYPPKYKQAMAYIKG